MLLMILITMSFKISVDCYDTGAPYGACHDLEPQHYGTVPNDPKQLLNPYSIGSLQENFIFQPGQDMQFKLSGHDFRGFIFQVRDELGRSRGRFSPVPNKAQTLTCRHSDDTLTHTSPDIKTELIFTWRAPDNARHQALFLSGTIVESENSFWSDKVVVLYSSLFFQEMESNKDKIDL